MPLLRKMRSVFNSWAPHVESPAPAEFLANGMMAAAIPALSFYTMLGLAAAIATLGLLSNSAPVVIGAMIVAPLMAPIISLAFGIVVGDWRLSLYSTLTITSGVALVIGFAFATTELIGLRIAGSEVISRTAPTLLDLGIACASGAAGAFVHTRKSIVNSIAGVAISVALVPPLCVVGIGLALGRLVATDTAQPLTEFGIQSGGEAMAVGAFTLFATNLIGIIVFAGLVFILHRYGEWKKALLGILLLSLTTGLVFQPLSDAFQRIYVKAVTVRLLTSLVARNHTLFTGEAKVQNILVTFQDETVQVTIDAIAPRDLVDGMQERTDVIKAHLTEILERDFDVRLHIIIVDTANFRSASSNGKAVQEEVLKEMEQ